MPHCYPFTTSLLLAAGLALAQPAAAQHLAPLPLRQPRLVTALPDSLPKLPIVPPSNLLVDRVSGVLIRALPAQDIFFPSTTIQPLLSRAAGVQ